MKPLVSLENRTTYEQKPPFFNIFRIPELRNKILFTVAMLVVYYGFILLVAFDKSFLATRLGDGVTTIGMPIGLAVIVFTVIITAIYVRRANREYDALTELIAKAALK